MEQTTRDKSNLMRLIMVILIAAMTQSIVVGIHESVHAVSCMLVGRNVVEYSAAHVDCQPDAVRSTSTRVVAGSAAIVNMLLGVVFYFVLRSKLNISDNWKWFFWLLMFANWSHGFGYFIFSGVSGAGDYAAVIDGWEPAALWRWGMLIIGCVLWFGAVWLSLRVLGQFFGGDNPLEIRKRFLGLSIPSYFSALLVALFVGLLNMHGFLGLPSIAGLMATAGTLSPFFWMPFWFASNQFPKQEGKPMTIKFDMQWVVVAVIVTAFYVVVLGNGFTFNGG